MAAAVLLKQRSQQMCLLQSIVAIILYAGHAAKKVGTYNLSACVWICYWLILMHAGLYTAWSVC